MFNLPVSSLFSPVLAWLSWCATSAVESRTLRNSLAFVIFGPRPQELRAEVLRRDLRFSSTQPHVFWAWLAADLYSCAGELYS